VFQEALLEGNMECFFPLIEQFTTQAEPAFCGLGTLAMVLNALEVDPGRVWKVRCCCVLRLSVYICVESLRSCRTLSVSRDVFSSFSTSLEMCRS